MYAMETFLVTLTFLIFLRLKVKIIYWIGFSLLLVLIAATDYLPLFVLPVFWIMAILRKDKSWMKKFILSHIPLMAFFIVWWPIFSKQLTLGENVLLSNPLWWDLLGKTTLKNLLLIPVKFVLGRISFYNDYTYALIAVPSVFLFFYVLLAQFTKIKVNLLLILWFVAPIVAAFFLGTRLSVFTYFRFIYVVPAFYLLISIGVNSMKKYLRVWILSLLLIINLTSAIYYLSTPGLHRENWRGLVNYINETHAESSVVLLPSQTQQEVFRYYKPEIPYLPASGVNYQYSEIWLVRYLHEMFDQNDELKAKIEDNGYVKVSEYDFNSVIVWKYQK